MLLGRRAADINLCVGVNPAGAYPFSLDLKAQPPFLTDPKRRHEDLAGFKIDREETSGVGRTANWPRMDLR